MNTPQQFVNAKQVGPELNFKSNFGRKTQSREKGKNYNKIEEENQNADMLFID